MIGAQVQNKNFRGNCPGKSAPNLFGVQAGQHDLQRPEVGVVRRACSGQAGRIYPVELIVVPELRGV